MIKFCRGSLIVFLSGLLFLTLGCSNEVKGEMKIISETTETVVPTIQNELEVHVEKDFAVAFNSLEDVKNAIEMGMTEEEIIASLGDNYIETIDAMDGLPVWRYDLNAIEEYLFEAFYDQVDIEGIIDEKLDYQVFLIWWNGRVVTYSIFYKANDNLVEGFYEFDNGCSKTDQIPIS